MLAEYRELCIQSSGCPITACSYFQYQEYPKFMTFFYVSMFLLEIIYMLTWFSLFLEACYRFSGVAKRLQKSDNGLLTLILPWRLEKSDVISQSCTYRAHIAIFGMWGFVGITAMSYVSMWSAPGFGLVNSEGTGMLYFGSDWNEFPIPTCVT